MHDPNTLITIVSPSILLEYVARGIRCSRSGGGALEPHTLLKVFHTREG